jgi:hypothetical protein
MPNCRAIAGHEKVTIVTGRAVAIPGDLAALKKPTGRSSWPPVHGPTGPWA